MWDTSGYTHRLLSLHDEKLFEFMTGSLYGTFVQYASGKYEANRNHADYNAPRNLFNLYLRQEQQSLRGRGVSQHALTFETVTPGDTLRTRTSLRPSQRTSPTLNERTRQSDQSIVG
jgi:hypothetical protein